VTTIETDTGARIIGMPWKQFIADFAARWEPGQHVALIGPTGKGKTTLAAQLVRTRKYVIAADVKGGDSSLGRFTQFGFQHVSEWPLPRQVREDIANGEPARLIVGMPLRTAADRPKLKALLQKTFGGVFEQGGWTLYIDELQLACDRRLMGLGPLVEENLIAARDRGVSVVSSFQQPAWVPRTASNQATHLFIWHTRDTDVVNRLAEMMGRPKQEVRQIMAGLASTPFGVLVTSADPSAPMLVTRPPRL